MTQYLNRAGVEIGETNGRTLSGIAMPWDTVSMVTDLVRGRPTKPYPEAFAPSSTDKSRTEKTSFPVFVGHDPRTEPIGVVTFSRSAEALMFDAPLSATPRADTFLELARDGAMSSVSIQFRPVADVAKTWPGLRQPVKYRTEVGLRHLALAPTGYGQYEDAQVLAIRDQLAADTTFATQTDAVRDAIEKSIGSTGLDGDPYVYVQDIADSWVVYQVEGGPLDVANTKRTLYRCDYTVADDGTVTLGEAVPVQVAYTPTAPAADAGRTDAELAVRDAIADRRRSDALELKLRGW